MKLASTLGRHTTYIPRQVLGPYQDLIQGLNYLHFLQLFQCPIPRPFTLIYRKPIITLPLYLHLVIKRMLGQVQRQTVNAH